MENYNAGHYMQNQQCLKRINTENVEEWLFMNILCYLSRKTYL